MMSTETIHVKISAVDRQRCHAAGFNVSGLCRKAIREMLEKVEPKETGIAPSTATLPAASPVRSVTHED
jgi:hypothetical protein